MQRLVGVNLLAFMTLYRGAPDHARYSYSQLPPDDVTAGRYTLGWRDWIIGISYLWEGQVDLAARKLRTALASAEEDSGRRSPISVTLASALAAAQWDRNEPEDAAALLADRLDVLERRAPPDAIIMGYVTTARVAALAGDEQRALELLDHLQVLGEARRLPRLRIASLGERMRMHALRGRGDMCAAVERNLDAIVDGLGDHRWGLFGPVVDLQVGSARAYAAVARRQWQDALERLGALAPAAERLRRGRDGVQIYLLRALAAGRCGKKDDASLLDEALSMARMWGLARILEDTHPDLARIAQESRADAEAVDGHDDARNAVQPLGRASGKVPGAPRARPARGSLLSPRERDVLRLLATGLSNKQIALAMDVTDETIKWHFKNLFRKLNAGSRSHLLHRARMVGVIDEAG
jgi:LuxR family maltose regulon positive regulatory protein